LLIGFFLPGDSLMVTAGLLCSQEDFGLNVWILGGLLTVAGIVGDSVGYSIGKATGPRIFTRQDSLLFNKKHLIRAHEFYEKHGAKTIVIARFMPIIRTFAPVVAGVAAMNYRTFVTFNVIGAFLWGVGLTTLGYFLGEIDVVKNNLEIAAVVIVAISVLPVAIEFMRHRKEAAAAESSPSSSD
jgi:membrane-associated protein